MSDELISKGLDMDIVATHQRFIEAMEERLPSMTLESPWRKMFSVVCASVLVLKLFCTCPGPGMVVLRGSSSRRSFP